MTIMPSPAKGTIPWPPQSPQDCLALSPRRNRLAPARDVSPSPSRPRTGLRHSSLAMSSTDPMDEDEDEEMLQLKLAQIEAKLRLKRLQKSKAAKQRPAPNFTSNAAAAESEKNGVQVPASPPRKPAAPVEPKSPARVLLGLDRGLSSRDVSLKRAPGLKPGFGGRPSTAAEPERPIKSFNERLKEERENMLEKQAREKRIEASRSKGFNYTPSTTRPMSSSMTSSCTTMDVGSSFGSVSSVNGGANGNGEKRKYLSSKHTSSASQDTTRPASSVSSYIGSSKDPPNGTTQSAQRSDSSTTSEAGYCAYSALHLTKRNIPHIDLTRTLTGKTVYQIPQILKTIVGPHFEPPDVEGDWVVFGIIANKSEPRQVKQAPGANLKPTKYQATTLTDLKWEVDLMLFGDAFNKYHSLPVGTVIAILNPDIMKPRNPATNKFTLSLNSDDETILEVGVSRDLAFCKSIKKDGKRCDSWVDKRHTEFCSFHVELSLQKARSARTELHNSGRLFEPPRPGTSSFGGRNKFGPSLRGAGRGGGGGAGKDNGLLPADKYVFTDAPQRFGGAGGKVFLAPPSMSTNSLLEDDPFTSDTKESRFAKRIAEQAKEREIARKLIDMTAKEPGRGGLGAEYLRAQHLNSAEAAKAHASRSGMSSEAIVEGLGKRMAEEVRLSPIKKRKKVEFVDDARAREVLERRKKIWQVVGPQGAGEDDDLEFI